MLRRGRPKLRRLCRTTSAPRLPEKEEGWLDMVEARFVRDRADGAMRAAKKTADEEVPL